MILRSLRWRLLGGAAATVLLALCVAWLFMTLLFERHLERRLESELTRDGLRLVAALGIDAAGAPTIHPAPMDPRLQTPAGGYYWQVTSAGGAVRSRSLWDGDLSRPEHPSLDSWTLRRDSGPYGQPVSILERMIAPDAHGPSVLVQLAQDSAPLTSARDEFGRELAMFLTVLWLVLSAAAWLQVRLGLHPLGRIRSDLAALRDSASARLPDARLREIRPLTDAINALADVREQDLELARRRAADMAHGLKTPLAVIAAQGRRAREAGADRAAEGMDRAVAAIRRTIDFELARARIAAIQRAPGGSSRVHTVVERLVNVLEHTDKGGQLAFTIDIPPDMELAVQPGDLSELLGAVLENATRHARRQVRINATSGPQGATLAVDDDGPGIDDDRLEQVMRRGSRLDEGGTGLGLSIAHQLTEATGGGIRLSRSPLGGLAVTFTWPPRDAGQAYTA